MMAAGVRWCILVTVTLNWLTIAPLNAGPVSINPAISPFGRNIRPITCKSKTGQLGTCMFAMDCTRMNGQHLGTCIDRFYFGSCCAPSDAVAFPAFPSATTEGFNGGNDLGFSSSLPSAPVSPLQTTTSQHPNILTDLTTTTASSALPTLGVTQTSSAPVTTTTTVASTTIGEVTNPTLAQILASTPLSTLLANPPSTTEAAHTTVKASTQQPAIGTDSPSTSSPVEETTNATTITTTTTTPAPTTTTTIAAIILDITNSTTTSLSPTTTPEIGTTPATTTTTTLPSTTVVSSAAPQAETTTAAAPTPGLTNPAELTAVGSSSASPVSPEESTATDEPQGDQEDELTTLEPITDLPSVSLETDVETEIPSVTEETVEVTTVEAPEEEEEVTKTGPESTDANQEEVVTGSSLTVQTETQAPVTTTTTTAATTPAAVVVVTEAVTKSPVTSPASPSTTTAVPDTTTAAAQETTTVTVVVSTSPSAAPETTIASATASPTTASPTTASPTTASPTTAVETTTPVPASSSSSPVTTTLGPSTSIISEEPSTSQPETSVATTEGPIVEMTAEPVSSEPTTTPATVSTTLAELNDTIEGPTVQFQNYREVCGRPKYQYPSARIVGGTTTQYGQWPWQVSLRQWRTATFLHKCGAALLNENWAITAAHCVDNVQPDDLLLRMGEYDLATDEEEYPYIERKVQIVASHPQFDSRTFEYDLALLRFYDPVRFQPNIVPICLPPPSEVDFVGRTAYVTGWGRLYEDGPLPSKMQQVSVPVINNTDCENMYRRAGYVEHIPNIFICAGYADGKRDSCEGDSGGPMVIQEEQSWVLAGVISWGIGCAEANQPGVYTRISEFREWIDKIIVF